jgi:hypothetical protein
VLATLSDHRHSLQVKSVSLPRPLSAILLAPHLVDLHRYLHVPANYPSAYIAMLVGYSIKLIAVLILYLYMYRANKARDAKGPADEKAAIELGMRDVTELDNPGFRYSL